LIDSIKFNKIVWFYGVLRHFQQYFSYIVAVSFIGGGNRRTTRKPLTCRKSLTNFILLFYTPRLEQELTLKPQHQW
jgi:hypothetical protein